MSFTRLDPTDFVVSTDSVTAPAWSNNVTILTSFYTASASTTGSYYVNVYNNVVTNPSSSVQFAVAYGRADGSGSAPLNTLVPQNTPTRITFGQYRNLIYGDAESNVNFGTGNTASLDLIAIPIDRNRYKESLFPGTFNLTVGYGTSGKLNLTDNSNDVSTITYVDGGRVFNIVSGSNGTAANTPLPLGAPQKGYTVSGSYGMFLPDIGLIVLNPQALLLPPASGGLALTFATSSADNTVGASSTNNNRIFQIINSGSSFQLNSQENVSSDYVFVRVKNQDYNYTTNPSFITGSTGALIYSNFINSPQTFPTTVGLYNDNNELLAVAKLSQPLTKDFTKEALIRVKLDW
jgi:hypothetical protein